MKKLRDFLDTITLLSRPQGVSYKEIQDRFECTYRTAQRQIESINTIFPIQERPGLDAREKRFFLTEEHVKQYSNRKMPNLDLDAEETTALMFLWSRSDIFKDTIFKEHIERAFSKIFTIDSNHLDQFRALSDVMLLGENKNKDYSGKEDLVENLIHAMIHKKICSITYHAFWKDRIKTYQIHPLYIFQRDGGLYVFTQINDYKDIRSLAVERIKTLEISEECFIPPEDFDPGEYLETTFNLSFGEPRDYKILFSPEQARYIKERKWAREQKTETLDDGSLILTMRTSGWYDVKRWVMSYGPNARIIEPAEMRDEILMELKQSIKKYS